MKHRLLFLFACLFFVSAKVFALEVASAEFGVFDASDPQRVVFSPATVVPRREGFDLRLHARDMADHGILAEHAARVRAALD